VAAFHGVVLLVGIVGIATYSWAIPILGVVGVALAIVAYRFPPKAPDSAMSLEHRPDLPERFDDGQP
jgi:hypothetical protein